LGGRLWPISGHYPNTKFEELRKPTKYLNKDSQCPSQVKTLGDSKNRMLHNEELLICNSKTYYDDQIKRNQMGAACSTHGRDENAYISVGKYEM
jgi:hypothetical protein